MAFEVNETEYERLREQGYETNSALGVLFIQSLSDADLLDGARDETSSGYRQVLAFLGKDTNRTWITSQCAQAAYVRDLIDERELDNLMED